MAKNYFKKKKFKKGTFPRMTHNIHGVLLEQKKSHMVYPNTYLLFSQRSSTDDVDCRGGGGALGPASAISLIT